MIRQFAFVLAFAIFFSTLTQARLQHQSATQAKADSLLQVKDDRFTGKRTVTLAPIRISADLEMQLSGVIETARKPDYMEQDLGVMVTAEFATPAESKVEFTREMDFIFLVDGKRTMRLPSTDNFGADVMRRDGRRTAIGVLPQSTLERIASGRKVEIKLGDTEVALDEATLKNIRAFVAALRR